MVPKDQILPSLPLRKGGIPRFEKEGLGEILIQACLLKHGLFRKKHGKVLLDKE